MAKHAMFKGVGTPKIAKMRGGRPVLRTAVKTLDALGNSHRVDRTTNTIYGVTAMNVGEALGHYVWADQKTLQMTVDILRGKKLRSRLGHPAMSENSVGKKMGYGINWRLEGDSVRHDLQLMEAARLSPVYGSDPVEYILSMAENEPEEIGESFVVRHDLAWLMEDGTDTKYLYWYEKTPKDYPDHDDESEDRRPLGAVYPYPSIRPLAFYYIDVVNEGALTHNGMFSQEIASMFAGTSSEYAQEIFQAIDELRAQYDVPIEDIPRKAALLVSTYLQMRGERPKGTFFNEVNMNPKDNEDEVIVAESSATESGDGHDDQSSQFDLLVAAMSDALGLELFASTVESLAAQVNEIQGRLEQLGEIVQEVADEGVLSRAVPNVGSRTRQPAYVQRLQALGFGNGGVAAPDTGGIPKPPAVGTVAQHSEAITKGKAGRALRMWNRNGGAD